MASVTYQAHFSPFERNYNKLESLPSVKVQVDPNTTVLKVKEFISKGSGLSINEIGLRIYLGSITEYTKTSSSCSFGGFVIPKDNDKITEAMNPLESIYLEESGITMNFGQPILYFYSTIANKSIS